MIFKTKPLSPLMRAALGGLVWLVVVWSSVQDVRSFQWASALLLLAALVLVPLVIALVREPAKGGWTEGLLAVVEYLQLPAAAALMLSAPLPSGWPAAALAAPWIALTFAVAVAGVGRLWQRGGRPRWALARDVGLVFFAVAGAWTFAFRLGLQPLGFSFDIVQLTAVHFHYAGLVLPVVTALVLRETRSSRAVFVAMWGVLVGVPLVAVGITATQLGAGHGVELLSALVLGGGAMAIAIFQVRLARETRWPLAVRVLWVVAGFSLFFGMLLAVLYAARPYVAPLPWLDIPWMRALHGSANALGFAACALVGWTLALRATSAKPAVTPLPPARGGQRQQRRDKPKRR